MDPTDGLTDHVTAVFDVFVTVAENCCVWDAESVAANGLTVTAIDGYTVTAADPDFVPSATLVAVTVTVCWVVMLAGAV